MKEFDPRLNAAWWALRIALGLGPIIAGVDKYFNKLADWAMYLSPIATKLIPVKDTTFMHVVGVVEIIAGVIVLTRWTKIGSYIVGLWLLAIAANLLQPACSTTSQSAMSKSPSARSRSLNSARFAKAYCLVLERSKQRHSQVRQRRYAIFD